MYCVPIIRWGSRRCGPDACLLSDRVNGRDRLDPTLPAGLRVECPAAFACCEGLLLYFAPKACRPRRATDRRLCRKACSFVLGINRLRLSFPRKREPSALAFPGLKSLGPRFSGETPVVQAFLCLSEAPGKPERRVRVPLGAKSRRRRRPRADAGGHSHPRALVPAAPPLADARLQPGNSSRRISAGRKKSYFCKDGFAACAALNSRTCG